MGLTIKNHWKLYGEVGKNNLEVSLDFSRWLIGFGWISYLPPRYKKTKAIHFNLGPLAVIVCLPVKT